jgi:hypothetical protein
LYHMACGAGVAGRRLQDAGAAMAATIGGGLASMAMGFLTVRSGPGRSSCLRIGLQGVGMPGRRFREKLWRGGQLAGVKCGVDV